MDDFHTPAMMRRVFDYSPHLGTFYWRYREPDTFIPKNLPTSVVANRWNPRFAYKQAFTCFNPYGQARVNMKVFLAHRVAWACHYDVWPGIIDHIDGDPTNNAIRNLREVSAAENARNMAKGSRNKSGRVGVDWDAARGRWRAYIGKDGKQTILGRFNSLEDAVAAREAAEVAAGYHANHGRP